MIIVFEKTYLRELYVRGRASDKKHRFQPAVVTKYVKGGFYKLIELYFEFTMSRFEFKFEE